ncbi:hypothetical protein ACQR50_10465 [Sphingomonas sp. Xoc002]|uniref:hypothetical protein n=1 Tax=Sphingomonas sp. Xoc002 TaxID=2837624 RepID=UPI003D165D1C
MRLIQIVAVAVVAGAVRHAIEGPIPVRDDEEAARLVELGLAEFADEVADGDEGDDEDLVAMQVPYLKKLAEDEGVDLGSATKKADIIAAINAHRAAAGQ